MSGSTVFNDRGKLTACSCSFCGVLPSMTGNFERSTVYSCNTMADFSSFLESNTCSTRGDDK